MRKHLKQKNGQYQISVNDIYGKRHRNWFKTRAEADAYVSKIENVKNDAKLNGLKMKKERYALIDAIENFRSTKSHLRPKSVQKYKFVIDQFILFVNALQLTYLDEFTPDHGSILFRELTKEKPDPTGNTTRIMKPKPKTVNFHLQSIKSFFEQEVLSGHLTINPMNHVKCLKVEKRPPDYYSREELKLFFDQEMADDYRNVFLGLLYTGMRVGELINTTWDDIDYDLRLIHVRPKNDFHTKTSSSERSIPLSDKLYELLQHINANKKSQLYVFPTPLGNISSERTLLTVCKQIGKGAGIKTRLYIHKFRHTFATQLVQRRVPIEAIQKLLGHTSITQTMVYAHVKSEQLHDDVRLLDNLF